MYKWLMQLRLRFSYRCPLVLHIALCWIFGLIIAIFFALIQGIGSYNNLHTHFVFTYSYGGFVFFSLCGILLAFLFLTFSRFLFYVTIFIRAFLQAYCFIIFSTNLNVIFGLYIMFSQICNNCILLLVSFLIAKGTPVKSVFCPCLTICALFSLIHLLLL